MSSFVYLHGALIDEVMDARTGKILNARKVVGDNDNALYLRTHLMENIENGTPLYLCPECSKPIYLRANPQKTGQYFVHRDVDGNCPKNQSIGLSEEVLRAIKYNGAKESAAHAETKQLLLDCLEADPRFSEQVAEKVWVSGFDEGKFRRPDVQTVYDAGKMRLKVAFEIQLSSTFLSEIVQRREFYRKENALLIWVFRNFVKCDPRMTQIDIFYPNNRNAFVVNHETAKYSIDQRKLFIKCHWSEPKIRNYEVCTVFNDGLVAFDSLVLDKVKQQAYFFDYNYQLDLVENELNNVKLQALVSEFKEYSRNRTWPYNDPNVLRFREEFQRHGIVLSVKASKLHSLIKAIYSLEEGKPVGSGFKRLVEFGHKLYDSFPDMIFFFLVASMAYDRKEALLACGSADKWQKKKDEVWVSLNSDPRSRFRWNKNLAEFIFLLFPEVKPFFKKFVAKLGNRFGEEDSQSQHVRNRLGK